MKANHSTALGRRAAAGLYLSILAAAIPLALAGCGTTKEARSVTPAGFLGNYSDFRRGVGNEPYLIYANPTADCRKYTKVMIDPVTLWSRGDDSSLQKLEEKDRDMLRALGSETLRQTVTQAGLTVVDEPGPDVMRMRAAFTDAEKANVLLEDISAAAPYVSGAATLYAEEKGQALWTGDVAYEMEFLDSMTGERLSAAVDKRVGLLDIRNLDAWDSVRAALKVWQERGTKRLISCQQTGSFTTRPREQTLDQQ
ncbi:MAG: DUF3313 domain-containing protein, partial [Gammaproteobacteria bacterium]|nr:DUF3313 domain-containing protein [Gammaproteobacteria bacterium]